MSTPADLTLLPSSDPLEIYRYRDGLDAVDLITAAVCELDLFTWLAAHPMDTSGICRSLELAFRPVDVRLTLFAAERFVRREGEVWAVTPLAREHLVSTSPFFPGPYYASLKERPVVRDYVAIPRTGRPASWGSYRHEKAWSLAMGAEEFATTLPTGFDLHLYSNVLHDWDVPQVRQLLAASFQALEPGGDLIVHDAHLAADKCGPLAVAKYSALLMAVTTLRSATVAA
jgi:hypothetical protein